jgi:quercetin dioxygenase-like cupin family protein
MSGFEIVHADELEQIHVAGVVWRPLRRKLGIRAFGTNVYSAAGVGEQIVEEHDESTLGHEEMYVVLRGRVTFTIGGGKHEADAGTIVFVRDPRLRRVAVAESEDALVLAIGNAPGKAYEPSEWEDRFYAGGVTSDRPEA